jgi:hypothetical protein
VKESLVFILIPAMVGFLAGVIVSRRGRVKRETVMPLIIPQTYERLQNTLNAGPLTAKDAAYETVQKLRAGN